MSRVIPAFLLAAFVATALATAPCTKLPAFGGTTSVGYDCGSDFNALPSGTTSGVPSSILEHPVVFYDWIGDGACAGVPYDIQIFGNFSCYGATQTEIQGQYCTADGSQVIYYAGAQTAKCYSQTSGFQTFSTETCYSGNDNSFVYLCPGDLTVACNINAHQYRSYYTLECVNQTVYTGDLLTQTGTTHPDVYVHPWKTCDIYVDDQVSSGYQVTSSGNAYCCKHRGVINGGICEQGTCGGYTTSSDYFFQHHTSGSDGQYCFNDCFAFGDVDVEAELILHFGPTWFGGVEEYDTASSNDTDTTVYLTVPYPQYDGTQDEVGYYIVDSNSTNYGCRFAGVYTTPGGVPTCTVQKGCAPSYIYTAYTSGIFYSGSTCFAECLTEGEQFAYPIVIETKRRSVSSGASSKQSILKL